METVEAREPKTQGELIRGLLVYLKPYGLYIGFCLLFALISVAAQLFIPVLVGQGINTIAGRRQVDFPALWTVLFRIGLVIVIFAPSQWLMNVCGNHIGYGMVRDMRSRAFEKIESLPLNYLDGHSHGDLLNRVGADMDLVAEGLIMSFSQFFTGIVTIVGTLGFMFAVDYRIAFVVVLLTPLSFVLAKYVAKHSFRLFRRQSELRGDQAALISEMIGGQKVVQAFGQEESVLGHFDEINKDLADASLWATFISSVSMPATRFVNGLVYASVAVIGGLSVISGDFSVGQLTIFLSYAMQYTKPFNEISGVVTELQNAIACAGRVIQLIEEKSQKPDWIYAVDLEGVKGKVELEDVCFSYSQEKPLIEDFNIELKPGQRVALVGPTGCGKTTLINLLMRFYEIDRGEIRVEDVDVQKLTRRSLRSSFGMVLQDTWLKKGSIRDNLLLGKREATEEEMIRAAKAAHAHSFIERLPHGYDTQIGEEGDTLSAGQKQLLCIARVMLCDPPMLILDEATSSIDTRTEIIVQSAFTTMMKERTCFIVAHRLSTIRNADVILFMKDGKIMERGSHEELLAKDGYYASLYRSQYI